MYKIKAVYRFNLLLEDIAESPAAGKCAFLEDLPEGKGPADKLRRHVNVFGQQEF